MVCLPAAGALRTQGAWTGGITSAQLPANYIKGEIQHVCRRLAGFPTYVPDRTHILMQAEAQDGPLTSRIKYDPSLVRRSFAYTLVECPRDEDDKEDHGYATAAMVLMATQREASNKTEGRPTKLAGITSDTLSYTVVKRTSRMSCHAGPKAMIQLAKFWVDPSKTKTTRAPYFKGNQHLDEEFKMGEALHVDFCGPWPTRSLQEHSWLHSTENGGEIQREHRDVLEQSDNGGLTEHQSGDQDDVAPSLEVSVEPVPPTYPLSSTAPTFVPRTTKPNKPKARLVPKPQTAAKTRATASNKADWYANASNSSTNVVEGKRSHDDASDDDTAQLANEVNQFEKKAGVSTKVKAARMAEVQGLYAAKCLKLSTMLDALELHRSSVDLLMP
eukprot:g14509.t1